MSPKARNSRKTQQCIDLKWTYHLFSAVVALQAFVATGTNIQLVFNPSTNGYSTADHGRECDFDKEHGKVSRTAPCFINTHKATCQYTVVTLCSQLLSSLGHNRRHLVLASRQQYCGRLCWHSGKLGPNFPLFFEQLCDLKRLASRIYIFIRYLICLHLLTF
jgi:hypothetical protein